MRKLTLSILLAFSLSLSLFPQGKSSINYKQLDEYFSKMINEWDLPGMSIGIVKDGKLVFTGNYGVMELGGNKKPDKNTLYAIASNSKAFTAAMIGILVQEGKLDWNDKVKKYIPDFSLFNDPWISNEVTIRDLLCHRVGLGTFSGDVIWYKSNFKSSELYKLAANLPQENSFRAGYGYSNHMYIVAGEIIKIVTGKSWSENIKERFFDPLGMNRSITTTKDLDKKGNFATPHGRIDEKNFVTGWEDWSEIAAMGGIISSVEDVAKWMIFIMNNGINNNDTILRPSTINNMWTPHISFTVDHTKPNDLGRHFSGYGLGWSVGDYFGNFMVGHTGGYDGMISAVTLIPDKKLGVVVLTNGQKSPIMAVTYYTFDRFLNTQNKDWSDFYLKRYENRNKNDNRIENIKKNRILGTNPSLDLKSYSGNYYSDIYGIIKVQIVNNQLIIEFEHSPRLSATLKHWHYDVWEIIWDEKHAWFDFGTVKFLSDNNMKITGLEFEVPNDDIFFEELKPYKIK
ncbi:MAG: serine hydrolase [Bacteroidetes bacterium]|nr:serine hydrolase [Bacteroidota bacterium]